MSLLFSGRKGPCREAWERAGVSLTVLPEGTGNRKLLIQWIELNWHTLLSSKCFCELKSLQKCPDKCLFLKSGCGRGGRRVKERNLKQGLLFLQRYFSQIYNNDVVKLWLKECIIGYLDVMKDARQVVGFQKKVADIPTYMVSLNLVWELSAALSKVQSVSFSASLIRLMKLGPSVFQNDLKWWRETK